MAVIEVQIQRIVPELFYLSCVFNRNTVTGIRSSLHSIECQLAHWIYGIKQIRSGKKEAKKYSGHPNKTLPYQWEGNKLSKGPGDCHALEDFRVQCPLACQNIHLKAKNNSCSTLPFLHFLLIKKKQRFHFQLLDESSMYIPDKMFTWSVSKLIGAGRGGWCSQQRTLITLPQTVP